MKQIVAFNSGVDITFEDAIRTAKATFPNESFSGVSDLISLESYLSAIEQTLYVEIDVSKQIQAAIEAETALRKEIDEDLKHIACSTPPVTFDESDLDTDLCEDSPEFPPELDVAVDLDLTDIEAEQQAKINDALKCVSDIQKISENMASSTESHSKIKDTLVCLEELKYNYGIIGAYYQKRIDTMNDILKTFDPLLTRKKSLRDEIQRLTPLDSDAKQKYDSTQSKFNSRTPGTTQADVNRDKSAYDTVHAQLEAAKKGLDETLNSLSANIGKISPFVQEIDFENSNAYKLLSQSGRDAARLQWMRSNVSAARASAGGGSDIKTRVNSFSSRVEVSETADKQSFILTIDYDFRDDASILVGRRKSYLNSSDSFVLRKADKGKKPSGVLYDFLYNVWGDVDKFFSREERGLTQNSNFAAPSLKGTGAEKVNSDYVRDDTKFKEFYQNFQANHDKKVDFVKNTIIEPAFRQLVGNMENAAVREVEYILAYYKAFETTPGESRPLANAINIIRKSSEVMLGAISELLDDIAFVKSKLNSTESDIEKGRADLLKLPCAKTEPEPALSGLRSAGDDPLGGFDKNNPDDPEPTKFCYWLKFSLMATAVNVLPVPGPGGFKYWPIGFVIPTPAGLVKIPLPIVWIPISVISLPVGMFVIFIGLCGICPSPFVLYVGPNGEKKFIVSLRPTQEFGANASDGIMKVLSKGGLAINTKLGEMVNKISVPGFSPINSSDSKDTVLDEMKDNILKKVNKLGPPDISPITSKLTTKSTVSEKKAVLKEVVTKHLSKLKIPTTKIPKNAAKSNPKPPPVMETVNQLTKLTKMQLPSIAIPAGSTIDLKEKLLEQANKAVIPPVDLPPFDWSKATELEQKGYVDKVKNILKDVLKLALGKINPKSLGMAVSVLGSVQFMNPYKCKPGSKGLGMPPIPPAVMAGMNGMSTAIDSVVDGLTVEDIKNMLKGSFGVTADTIRNIIPMVVKGMPSIPVPDPSNISIKDMMSNTSKMLAAMQMPSLPDPSKPPQIQIPIPGEGVKSTIVDAVGKTIDSFPINDIDLSNMSGIDMKQLVVSLVENSFAPLENFLNPMLNTVSKYKDAKDKSFAETLGLKKLNTDHSSVPVVTPQALETATKILKGLSLVPYPAVAIAPGAFKNLHPILTSDDLPPWIRLSLDNFLFVCFLDQFCAQGKKGGGFFENP